MAKSEQGNLTFEMMRGLTALPARNLEDMLLNKFPKIVARFGRADT